MINKNVTFVPESKVTDFVSHCEPLSLGWISSIHSYNGISTSAHEDTGE